MNKVESIGGGKGWGYGAAAPPDFKNAHRSLFFTIEIFSCLPFSPTWFDYLPPPMDWNLPIQLIKHGINHLADTVFYRLIAVPQIGAALGWSPRSTRLKTT